MVFKPKLKPEQFLLNCHPDGPDYDYCVAGIDEDRIIATGLGPDYDDTYMFSRESNRS